MIRRPTRRSLLVLALMLAALPATSPAAITRDNVSALVQQWELETSAGVTGGAVLAGGTLYVGDSSGTIHALDPVTGAERWSTTVFGPVVGPVLATGDGGICYGTLGARVGCLDAADGGERWQKDLTAPPPGAVWSGLATANGRLFAGVASLSDNPCTRGRLVALDLADGHELWRFYTVPEKVCDTDTGQTCTQDADCPDGGTCVDGRGGGVTATVALDPTGEWVYMNTVGCYTFPSIGESDSIFKIEAATGDVAWRTRVNDPEQFGVCEADSGVDCGTDAHCAGVGGSCSWAGNPRAPKQFYHDFGFLNGPLYLELPAEGDDPAETLLVSASKNGTLYAFHEDTGEIAWQNAVQPTPISPGFAGFGLFNGAIAYADGRIHAALNNLNPSNLCDNGRHGFCRTDADCPGGTCVLEPEHVMAFDVRDGSIEWTAEAGRSWSASAVSGGVVYSGRNGVGEFFAHDAATGEQLRVFELPTASSARALVAGDQLFLSYGILSEPGGLRAYGLCGNGTVDPGEACDPAAEDGACCSAGCTLEAAGTSCGTDDGNPCTATSCDGAGGCAVVNQAGTCDDGNPCTDGDQCMDGTCVGTLDSLDQLGCALGELEASPCGDEALPRPLARLVGKRLEKARRMLAKAAKLSARGRDAKVDRLRAKAAKQLDAVARKAGKAAHARNARRSISDDCRLAIEALVTSRKRLIEGFTF